MPSPILRHSSAGTADVDWFLESGRQGANVVRAVLREIDPAPTDVLDFGCGCGRVARHLVGDGFRFRGVDWNEAAIRWCRRHLDGAFAVGSLEPPLPVDPDQRFDAIYAFSVFTHMPEALQRAWLMELGSRLKPCGVLALSTHGEAFADDLSADERRCFAAGELVVREPVGAGTNVCAAYHPPGSLEALLPSSLAVERHEPRGALGNAPQDLWVLRKPSS